MKKRARGDGRETKREREGRRERECNPMQNNRLISNPCFEEQTYLSSYTQIAKFKRQILSCKLLLEI